MAMFFWLRLGASISHSVCLSVCPQHEIGNVLPRPVFNIKLTMGLPLTVLNAKSATYFPWPFLYATGIQG